MSRSLRELSWLLLASALLVGCFQLAERWIYRWDFSLGARYTLPLEITQPLAQLTEEVVVHAYLPLSAPPPYREIARHTHDLLRELAALNSVNLQVIDSAADRSTSQHKELLRAANEAGVDVTRLTAERGGRQVFLEVPYGVSVAYLNRREVTEPVELLSEVEFQLARALHRAIEGKAKSRIGVSQGFGEPDLINSPLAKHLATEGELIPVRLDGDPIEDEVGWLIILGATQSYGERARWLIDRLRCDGGGVVIALDHRVQSEVYTNAWSPRPTGLEPLLRRYGIDVDPRWVIADPDHPSPAPLQRDARGHVIATPHPLYPMGIGQKHAITAPINDVPIPMAPLFTLPAHADVLVRSADSAVALRGLHSLSIDEAEERAQQLQGYPLAFAIDAPVDQCLSRPPTQQAPSPQFEETRQRGVASSRLVVIGSGRRLLSADTRGLELLMNSISWVRGEEHLLSLKRRRPTPKRLSLTPDQQNSLKWLTPTLPACVMFVMTFLLRVPRARHRKYVS